MTDDMKNLLHEIAGSIITFAELYDRQQKDIDNKLDALEAHVEQNKAALKSVANAILNTLG